MKTIGPAEVDAITTGATVLGAGGGGPYSLGLQFAKEIKEKMQATGREISLVEPSELAGDKHVAIPAGAGSPSAAATGGFPLDQVSAAFNELAKAVGLQGFDAVFPGEVGAGNSLIPLYVALDLDIPVIDSSGAARAMPSLQMSTCAAAGLPVSPIVLAASDHVVQFRAEPASFADATMRGIIGGGAFDEDAGVALWSMSAAQACSSGIGGTMSKANQLGQAIESAAKNKTSLMDAVQTVEPAAELLIHGKITDNSANVSGGFDHSIVTISDGDQQVLITGQNENLLAWKNSDIAPTVIAPDLVCYLGADGTPYSNADLGPPQAAGAEILVIAIPCPEKGREPAVVEAYLQLFRQLGYGGGYTPYGG